jgi:steroid delta-isomerase-like uncharacterized protein
VSAGSSSQAAHVALRYFDAIGRRDLDAALECWAPGGVDNLSSVGELHAPEGLRAYFGELFHAAPDFEYQVLRSVEEGELVAVHWRAHGTFIRGVFQGFRANGSRIEIEGIDLVRVEEGLISRNDSFWDDTAVARQVGLLPPRGSRRERALLGAFNFRTRLTSIVRRR